MMVEPKVAKVETYWKVKSTKGNTEIDVKERTIEIPFVDNEESRMKLVKRIEAMTLTIIQHICSGKLPSIPYPDSRNYDLIEEFEGSNEECLDENRPTKTTNFTKDIKKFGLMVKVLEASHSLLIRNTIQTRRAFYYSLKEKSTEHLMNNQRDVDKCIHLVSHLLDCAPWELGLVGSSKGLIAGDIVITLSNKDVVHCNSPGGTLIPQSISEITSVRTRAEFVLIVEKDSIFQQLLQENCPRILNCILITGKGYPDVPTRMLVKFLSEKMNFLVYAVVDADPFGVDIMCVYRYGSSFLSKENDLLACPGVRWLGIHPSELLRLGIREILPLNKFDLCKLQSIENRPYASGDFLKELQLMRQGKSEIELLSCLSQSFLTNVYLPSKIKVKDCI